MSIIRPEAHAALLRWREVVICAVVVLIGIRWMWQGIDLASIVLTVFGLTITALFAVLMFWAVLRAKLYKPIKAIGVVEVSEREVGYLAPDGGAFVSLDDLIKLEIVCDDKGAFHDGVFWVLTHLAGEPLLIPACAQGSDQLFDAFAALPKIDFELAARAMNSTKNATYLIWQRQEGRLK